MLLNLRCLPVLLLVCLYGLSSMVEAKNRCPPVRPGSAGICIEACGNCKSSQICCPNGCGHVCKEPIDDMSFAEPEPEPLPFSEPRPFSEHRPFAEPQRSRNHKSDVEPELDEQAPGDEGPENAEPDEADQRARDAPISEDKPSARNTARCKCPECYTCGKNGECVPDSDRRKCPCCCRGPCRVGQVLRPCVVGAMCPIG